MNVKNIVTDSTINQMVGEELRLMAIKDGFKVTINRDCDFHKTITIKWDHHNDELVI